MAFSSAFQVGAFQLDAFQVEGHVVSTRVIRKPVDYALAGEQLVRERGHDNEIMPREERETPKVMRSGVGRLSGTRPGFTTRTGPRGYD